MKVSIIADGGGKHPDALMNAAQKLGMEAEIVTLTIADLNKRRLNNKLGEAVIWRRSKLDIRSERPSLAPLLRNKVVVSDAVFKYPSVYFKYYQQQVLKSNSGVRHWSIPTLRFKTAKGLEKAIENDQLHLPVIAKPNAGSRGEGIILIQDVVDIHNIRGVKEYVFQSFIPNNGDWRVIVVGGVSIGVLARHGKEGQFINNISQGAEGSIEEDPETLNALRKIATKAASLFHLTFCGVDIIRNADTGAYSILEVNTAPQWLGSEGFQEITGINVADAVMDWIEERGDSQPLAAVQLVNRYYRKRIHQIPSEAFHFASRLWLWTGDIWARDQLDELKQGFIGVTDGEASVRIKMMIDDEATRVRSVNQDKVHRKAAFEKYKNLALYNSLLFKTVFCDSVYGMDIRPYIREHISDKEMITLFNELILDKDAVRLLSTHAVNFFYLLKNYFKDTLSLSSLVLVSPEELVELLPGYDALVSAGTIDHKTSIKLQIYLLTHAIIGESRFYERRVKASDFKKLCKRIEQLIQDNYYDVTLDNKLEFLVCSQICNYTPSIRSLIEQEAERSLSWAGNFIVDTYNVFADSDVAHCLRSSEHRNVLYIMSQNSFRQDGDTDIVKVKTKLPTIGRLARVKMETHGIRRAIARVDSGASGSSIAASNVFVKDNKLHFTLLYDGHPLYTGEEFIVDEFTNVSMRNTTSQQLRYAVTLAIEVNGEQIELLFSLVDRQHMLYPVLLGRDFLRGRYTVDTSRQFIERRVVNINKEVQ